jgi:hypothetical protein
MWGGVFPWFFLVVQLDICEVQVLLKYNVLCYIQVLGGEDGRWYEVLFCALRSAQNYEEVQREIG